MTCSLVVATMLKSHDNFDDVGKFNFYKTLLGYIINVSVQRHSSMNVCASNNVEVCNSLFNFQQAYKEV